jgi:hypothetical protein
MKHPAESTVSASKDFVGCLGLLFGGVVSALLLNPVGGLFERVFKVSVTINQILLYFFVVTVGFGWLALVARAALVRRRAGGRLPTFPGTPCKHGVVGVLSNPDICEDCVREREERQKQAKLSSEQEAARREQEAARRERESQERHREFVRKIRLPEHLRSMHPGEFEHLVCDLFRRQGYEAEPTPISGDGGVDGYLRKDGALAILQCKRVKGSVGEPVLRDLFGTMHSCGAAEGIVVTTGKVSTQARAWASTKPIRIIELEELTTLIRRHYKEDEVVPEEFQPKATPPDLCPTCGKPLRIVNGRRGRFLGCTGYPACRYTRPLGTPRPRRH